MNHVNFNTNLYKREYYKYFNLRKKFHINNVIILRYLQKPVNQVKLIKFK